MFLATKILTTILSAGCAVTSEIYQNVSFKPDLRFSMNEFYRNV
jgi:hypothetical protein